MSAGTIAALQAVTAIVAVCTSLINLGMLFKRQNDSGMKVIGQQSRALDKSNKRLTESLDKINTQLVAQMANIDAKLSHVQAVVDRI
jgi:hypothetical protein